MEIFKIPCQCGFEFVFERQPDIVVEVICPKCQENKIIDSKTILIKNLKKKEREE